MKYKTKREKEEINKGFFPNKPYEEDDETETQTRIQIQREGTEKKNTYLDILQN